MERDQSTGAAKAIVETLRASKTWRSSRRTGGAGRTLEARGPRSAGRRRPERAGGALGGGAAGGAARGPICRPRRSRTPKALPPKRLLGGARPAGGGGSFSPPPAELNIVRIGGVERQAQALRPGNRHARGGAGWGSGGRRGGRLRAELPCRRPPRNTSSTPTAPRRQGNGGPIPRRAGRRSRQSPGGTISGSISGSYTQADGPAVNVRANGSDGGDGGVGSPGSARCLRGLRRRRPGGRHGGRST